MIRIEKKQHVPDERSLVVTVPEGEYADTDLIPCAEASNPGEAIAQFQAQFIKYGPVVYQFNTPEELGAALFAIDPESAHDAVALYKEEEARKKARMAGTLEPENAAPAPDALAEEIPAEESEPADAEPPPEPPVDAAPAENDVPPAEESLPEPSADSVSTTTPSVPEPEPEPALESLPSLDSGEATDLSVTEPE